jgi:calcineurin-like phosphoesterase family protein
MMKRKIWFTADTHFGHKNIIKYCNRPFTSVAQMDATILGNINRFVKPDDELWHLGDWCMGGEKEVAKYRRLIKCKNVYIITGNHDKPFRKEKVREQFSGVWTNFVERKFAGRRITLCHYAMRVWNKSHHGAWHLHGHSHGSIPDNPSAHSIDVGIDLWDYSPISLEEIEAVMSQKNYEPVDHHGSRDDFDKKCKWNLFENQRRYKEWLE